MSNMVISPGLDLEVAVDLKYIKGFFDRLCSVDVPGRAIILTIQNKDLGRRVGARIRQERIACTMTDMGDRIKLRVSGRGSLQAWMDRVGFDDRAKSGKLQQILDSYVGEGTNVGS
jgi:hypothetical protein